MTRGLGKGLDSLIPKIYDENFDSNSTQSLEDMLAGEEESVESVIEDIESEDVTDESKEEEISQEEEEEKDDNEDVKTTDKVEEDKKKESDKKVKKEVEEENQPSEDISGENSNEGAVQTSQEIQVRKEHVNEVREIVNKNPRITLWSSRSSAVFRYLRKTEPEFSISKEASILIEEAVSKKYPEIWALFEDL